MSSWADRPSQDSLAALVGPSAIDATASVPDEPTDEGVDHKGTARPTSMVGDADEVASRLFRVHYGSLLQMARLLVDDTDTAEEVVQEAFARLYGSWRRLRDPGRAEAYLRSTVWNVSRDRLRRRRTVRRHEAVIARGPDVTERLVGRSPRGPADAVVDDEQRRQLAAAVDRLPDRQRACLQLRYWNDLSEREIAATLGISTGSVKRHVHRAIRRLTAELGAPESPDAPDGPDGPDGPDDRRGDL